MTEDEIYKYQDQFKALRARQLKHQKEHKEDVLKQMLNLQGEVPRKLFDLLDQTSLGAGPNTISRHLDPSFRSIHFDVGEPTVTVPAGQTRIVAQWFMPAAHSGVLKGFQQEFVSVPDKELLSWGLRINGQPIHGFSDWVGEISLPYVPRPVRYPLTGLDTLGSGSVSSGSPQPGQIPACHLQVTNNDASDVMVRGRIVGFTFPVDEVYDNFKAF